MGLAPGQSNPPRVRAFDLVMTDAFLQEPDEQQASEQRQAVDRERHLLATIDLVAVDRIVSCNRNLADLAVGDPGPVHRGHGACPAVAWFDPCVLR